MPMSFSIANQPLVFTEYDPNEIVPPNDERLRFHVSPTWLRYEVPQSPPEARRRHARS